MSTSGLLSLYPPSQILAQPADTHKYTVTHHAKTRAQTHTHTHTHTHERLPFRASRSLCCVHTDMWVRCDYAVCLCIQMRWCLCTHVLVSVCMYERLCTHECMSERLCTYVKLKKCVHLQSSWQSMEVRLVFAGHSHQSLHSMSGACLPLLGGSLLWSCAPPPAGAHMYAHVKPGRMWVAPHVQESSRTWEARELPHLSEPVSRDYYV